MSEIKSGSEALLKFLNGLQPLSKEIIDFAIEETFSISVKKNTLIDSVQKNSKECVFFVISGLVRGFIIDEEKEITTWLAHENSLIGTIRNPGNIAPTYFEHLQAIENSNLLVLPYNFIDRLYIQFPETNILGRKLLAIHFNMSQERSILSRIPSAEARYKQFKENHPKIKFRIPLKYLATYLGMRIETLSRIRNKTKLKP
ncbi:Crp/Fnr family transcriptional regulator [Pedobacter paludis]|uniref:Crp/Fnr family transcriptional regulator n=1 Tax=Pedobacter paludis TaxID=2203212 RepID=A0A317F2R9_9SPHI|nr:Crp/Fnr family transcriptional regulator [Pedobacter paludis]PWS33125.1 Crp/Fnr family transcriptional regulator [Pedobacter paludis]